MWNELQGTFVLFLVFQSSTTSDDSCTTLDLPIGSNRTNIFESFSWEAKYWIKPKSDFKRFEIHLKVDNILSLDPSYYLDNYILLESSGLLDPSYYKEPYWIYLKIRVYEKVILFGRNKLVLRAIVNRSMILELDEKLWWSQFKYQKYKLLTEGGLSFTNCNPYPLLAETPAKQNSTKENRNENPLSNGNSTRTDGRDNEDKYTFPFMTETPAKQNSTKGNTNENPLSNGNSTRTDGREIEDKYTSPFMTETTTVPSITNKSLLSNKSSTKTDNEDKYQRVTLADILKEDRKFSLVILLIIIVLIIILTIAAVCFVLWRKKLEKVNSQNKSQSENEGQDKTYETPSRVRYISHEKSIPPPVPSPIYPSLHHSISEKGKEEIGMENLYEEPKNCYSNQCTESQYLEMSSGQK